MKKNLYILGINSISFLNFGGKNDHFKDSDKTLEITTQACSNKLEKIYALSRDMANHPESFDKTNHIIKNYSFENKKLMNIDFSHWTLININFEKADLRYTSFNKTDFILVNLHGAILSNNFRFNNNLSDLELIKLYSDLISHGDKKAADGLNKILGSLNLYLVGSDLHDLNLKKINLRKADLSCTNLSGTQLIGADLSDTNLANTNLSYANQKKANLKRADLLDTNLVNTILIYAKLDGANLLGANLSHANLEAASLVGIILKNQFLYTRLIAREKTYLFYIRLINLHVAKDQLDPETLPYVDLVGGDIPQQDKIGAIFREANLKDADLFKANLQYCDLTKANLSKAIFIRADLKHAILEKTNFSHAKLDQLVQIVQTVTSDVNLQTSKGTTGILKLSTLDYLKITACMIVLLEVIVTVNMIY